MAELNLIVEDTLKKHARVSIKELNRTITQTLENRLSSSIIMPVKYRDAKRNFQKAYFSELLILNLGNISRAAQKAGLNRRQIHRICIEAGVNQKDIRKQMIKPYNYLKQNIQEVIEDRIEGLKEPVSKSNIDRIYQKMPQIADNITEFIEDKSEPYDEAFTAFERHYFSQMLNFAENQIEKAAGISGLSTRSILRKMQALNLV